MDDEYSNPCSVCGGTGWKPIEREEVRSVVRCDCFERAKLDNLFARAGVPARYEGCSFESFNGLTEGLRLTKAILIKFVEEYPVADHGLLLLGRCGVGKTHLAVAVLRALVYRRETECIFYDFRELLRKIQNSYNAVSQGSEMEILKPVLESPVVVLDDLGAERPTEWVRDTFAYILNSRYNRKLTTIITTNFEDRIREPRSAGDGTRLPTEETLEERIGVRLRSRLHEMCQVVQVDGEDFRAKVAKEHLRY
jgi:DNA replication protein DnaC